MGKKTLTAAFQDDSKRRVKEAADIVEVIGEHVSLQRAGARLKGLCPFHSEKTPSFTVNPDRQLFYCFGCKESGDVLSFMMKYHNMTFQDALSSLAERYGVVLEERKLSPEDQQRKKKRDALVGANEEAARLFHHFLLENPSAAPAGKYLEKRGMTADIISRFRLGYAPPQWDFLLHGLVRAGIKQDTAVEAGLLVQKEQGKTYDRFRDRIIFPIFSLSGQVVGFGGRILGDGQPKYLNSPETAVFDKSRTLFGLYNNKEAIRTAGRCMVVEGNFDLLSLVAYGLEYVAAPLGTALTIEHIKILKRYTTEVVMLFDGDEAGLKAAMRAVPLFLTQQLDAKIAVLPSEHDPDTFLQSYGKEAMEEKVAKAMELPEFVFGRLVNQYGLSLAGKGKIVRELRPIISAIGNRKLQKSLFVAHFSEKLGLQPEELVGSSASHIAKRTQPPVPVSAQHRQLLEFLLICPEALPRFLDAGLEEIVADESGWVGNILARLKEFVLRDEGCGVEGILDGLAVEEKDFVSAILVNAPAYTDEVKEVMAVDMAAWVRKQAWQGRKSRLMRRINEAQYAGDDDLLMELLEKKKEMDEVVYT